MPNITLVDAKKIAYKEAINRDLIPSDLLASIVTLTSEFGDEAKVAFVIPEKTREEGRELINIYVNRTTSKIRLDTVTSHESPKT